MGIFDKDKSISRRDLRGVLRKDRGYIEGGEGRYTRQEREQIHKDVFGPKYGSDISKLDYRRAIRDLENKRSGAKDIKEREKIDDKIKYLKQLGGRGF